MEIGYKINKPLENQEQCDLYSSALAWALENNAHIEDKENCYEVVENDYSNTLLVAPINDTPTVEDLVEAISILTDYVFGESEVTDNG